MRAGDGLDLKKYFALAFGNIFASGALLDPAGKLAVNQSTGKPIPFQVCGERTITIVAGWDKAGSALAISATTPSGATVTASTAGVAHATGRTWTFLRINLPLGKEANGKWVATVKRAAPFPEQAQTLNYFVNVIAGGGAKLTRWPGQDFHFTGDDIHPVVRLAGGAVLPRKAKVNLTVTGPTASAGTILVKAGKPQPPANHNGDTMPSRQTTMLALERSSRRPLTDYAEHRFELPAQTAIATRGNGLFGTKLADFLTVEGTYTFHAVATYQVGDDIGSREMQWSVEVEVGVDQQNSDVKITTGATLTDKTKAITVVVVPRDSFGNHVGPGRPDAFTISGISGTTLTGAMRDNGDGSYSVAGVNDPKLGKPGIVLARPERCPCRSPTRPGVQPGKR
jgi:hypothetical protein